MKNDWIPWIFSRLQRDVFQGDDLQGCVVAISTALEGLGDKVDFEFVTTVFTRLNLELSKVSSPYTLHSILPLFRKLTPKRWMLETFDPFFLDAVRTLIGWCVSIEGNDFVCRSVAAALVSEEDGFGLLWQRHTDFALDLIVSLTRDVTEQSGKALTVENLDQVLNLLSSWVVVFVGLNNIKITADLFAVFHKTVLDTANTLMAWATWAQLDALAMRCSWWLPLLTRVDLTMEIPSGGTSNQANPLQTLETTLSVKKWASSLTLPLTASLQHLDVDMALPIVCGLESLLVTGDPLYGDMLRHILFSKESTLRMVCCEAVKERGFVLPDAVMSKLRGLYVIAVCKYKILAVAFLRDIHAGVSFLIRQSKKLNYFVSAATEKRKHWVLFLLQIIIHDDSEEGVVHGLRAVAKADSSVDTLGAQDHELSMLATFPRVQREWFRAMHKVPFLIRPTSQLGRLDSLYYQALHCSNESLVLECLQLLQNEEQAVAEAKVLQSVIRCMDESEKVVIRRAALKVVARRLPVFAPQSDTSKSQGDIPRELVRALVNRLDDVDVELQDECVALPQLFAQLWALQSRGGEKWVWRERYVALPEASKEKHLHNLLLKSLCGCAGDVDKERKFLADLQQLFPQLTEHLPILHGAMDAWFSRWISQHCVWFRLRTEMGGAAKTLEKLLKLLVKSIKEADAEPDESVPTHRRFVAFVVLLLEDLDRHMKLAADAWIPKLWAEESPEGTSSLQLLPLTDTTRSFFVTNQGVCAEWVGRISLNMLQAARQCSFGIGKEVYLHGWQALQRLSGDTGEEQAQSMRKVCSLIARSALAVKDKATVECLRQWGEEADESSLDWVSAATLQCEDRLEAAARMYQDLAAKSYYKKNASVLQMAVNGAVECYAALCDWDSLDAWVANLHVMQEQAWNFEDETFADALTPQTDIDLLSAFAAFDRGHIHDAAKLLERSFLIKPHKRLAHEDLARRVQQVDRFLLVVMLSDHGLSLPAMGVLNAPPPQTPSQPQTRAGLLTEAQQLLKEPVLALERTGAIETATDVASRLLAIRLLHQDQDASHGAGEQVDSVLMQDLFMEKSTSISLMSLTSLLRVARHVAPSGNTASNALLYLCTRFGREAGNLSMSKRYLGQMTSLNKLDTDLRIGFQIEDLTLHQLPNDDEQREAYLMLSNAPGISSRWKAQLNLKAAQIISEHTYEDYHNACQCAEEIPSAQPNRLPAFAADCWDKLATWAATQPGLTTVSAKAWLRCLQAQRPKLVNALKLLDIMLHSAQALDDEFLSMLEHTNASAWTGLIPQLISASRDQGSAAGSMCMTVLGVIGEQCAEELTWPVAVARRTASEAEARALARVCGSEEVSAGIERLIDQLLEVSNWWEERWYGLIQRLCRTQRGRTEKEVKRELSSGEASETVLQHRLSTMMRPTLLELRQLYEGTIGRHSGRAQKKRLPRAQVKFISLFGRRIKQAIEGLENVVKEPHTLQHAWDRLENDVGRSLRVWMKQRSNVQYSLRSFSPALVSSFKEEAGKAMLRLPMPNSKGVEIIGLEDRIMVLGTKTRPKRLWFKGSDGVCKGFLLKVGEDLRVDERIMQLMHVCNQALEEPGAVEARAMHLAATMQPYHVLPLSSRSGLIEWVDGGVPLYRLFVRSQRERQARSAQDSAGKSSSKGSASAPPKKAHNNDFRSLVIDALKVELGISESDAVQLSRQEWPASVMSKVFRTLASRAPKRLLADCFSTTAADVNEWWTRTTTYGKSCAVSSMVGHMVGLGDRHLDNILVNLHSGNVVHIDYNICFDKGKQLRVPETVPFRLTNIMQEALPLHNVKASASSPSAPASSTAFAGIFGASCAATLQALHRNRAVMKLLMETLLKDPYIDWLSPESDVDQARGFVELKAVLELLASRLKEKIKDKVRIGSEEASPKTKSSEYEGLRASLEESLSKMKELQNKYESLQTDLDSCLETLLSLGRSPSKETTCEAETEAEGETEEKEKNLIDRAVQELRELEDLDDQLGAVDTALEAIQSVRGALEYLAGRLVELGIAERYGEFSRLRLWSWWFKKMGRNAELCLNGLRSFNRNDMMTIAMSASEKSERMGRIQSSLLESHNLKAIAKTFQEDMMQHALEQLNGVENEEDTLFYTGLEESIQVSVQAFSWIYSGLLNAFRQDNRIPAKFESLIEEHEAFKSRLTGAKLELSKAITNLQDLVQEGNSEREIPAVALKQLQDLLSQWVLMEEYMIGTRKMPHKAKRNVSQNRLDHEGLPVIESLDRDISSLLRFHYRELQQLVPLEEAESKGIDNEGKNLVAVEERKEILGLVQSVGKAASKSNLTSSNIRRLADLATELCGDDGLSYDAVYRLVQQIEQVTADDSSLEHQDAMIATDRNTQDSAAAQVLQGFTAKLDKAASSKLYAQRLIREATSEENLSRMYEGWMAWI